MADKKAIPLQRAAVRAATRPCIDLWALASYMLVALAALVPRALDLGQFITDDEANFWLRRSEVFLNALRAGDYIQTAITTHPGVTTMWLGATGILLRGPLFDWGILQSDTFAAVLAVMRLPAVLAHVAVILVCYGLLRRMLPALLALLAALLWAADPFVIGYSRLLHTDALAMSFATLSLLAACYYWNHSSGRGWLIVSGVGAGLAFLSKSPSLILLPAVGLVALLAAAKDQGPRTKETNRHSSLVFGLWSLVLPLLLWGLIAALTVFALWPALWVSPVAAYGQVQLGVVAEGAQPHMLGNFFRGQWDDVPGLLYYPLALPLRLTPWTLLGLLPLPIVWWRAGWTPAQRRDFAALAGFAILFVAAMSVFPKKFDRYIVPIFPALDILAAAGLIGTWELAVGGWWGRRNAGGFPHPPAPSPIRGGRGVDASTRSAREKREAAPPLPRWERGLGGEEAKAALVAAIALAALVNVAWWQPYQIVAFNQLFGGTAAGARTFFMGWGEGLDQVAGWLNQQPDITSVRTISLRVTSLNPYLKDGAQADFPKGDQLRDQSGYVVVYLPQVQGGPPLAPFDQFYGHVEPQHVVRIHGVEFAWIYRVPPQVAERHDAGFGPDIRLYGFDRVGEWRRGQTVKLRLVWQTSAQPPADYWMFAHLVGPDGQRYDGVDLPLPTSQWAPGPFAATELPISLPENAPAGAYRLLIGLYSPEGGQRLALAPADPNDAAPDSESALVLARFELK